MSNQISIVPPHRWEDYCNHLKRLDIKDRVMRFGSIVKDQSIEKYVQNFELGTDIVFGVYDDNANMIGAIHLAMPKNSKIVEIGLSVEKNQRGNGLGNKLMGYALIAARNRGREHLHMQCLTENSWIMKKCQELGMTIDRELGEATADLTLLPPNMMTIMLEASNNYIGFWDYLGKMNPLGKTGQASSVIFSGPFLVGQDRPTLGSPSSVE